MSIEENGYKEVQLGPKIIRAPSSWNINSLGSIAETITKGTTPTSVGFDYQEEGINFLKVENIKKNTLSTENLDKISFKANEKLSRSKLHKGDILFSIAGSLGECMTVREKYLPANINQALSLIRINENLILNDFVEYYLKGNIIQSYIKAISTVSAQPNLSLTQVSNFKVLIPPILEQNKIAEVLSTVDDAIQKTEEIIERSKELKKGLMQDLLTKGIGHEEFKEVKLGPKTMKIPTSWKVKKISNITESYAGGTPSRSNSEYYGGKIPWIKSGELNADYIDNVDEFITDKGLNNSSATWVSSNSVLVAMYGATAGQVAYLNTPATTNQAILALPPSEKDIYDSTFLFHTLKVHMKRLVAQRIQGSGQQNLSKTLINKLEIPLPPLREQEKIAEILSTIDEKIQKEKDYKEKLEQLKKGLMQDLLTGKVRVLPLLSDEEKEVIKEADVPG